MKKNSSYILGIIISMAPCIMHAQPIPSAYVLFPSEMQQCVELLLPLDTEQLLQRICPDVLGALNQENPEISLQSAQLIISLCNILARLHNEQLSPEELISLSAYLSEYKMYIGHPQAWIDHSDDAMPTRGANKIPRYEIVLDLWAQHSLRAFTLMLDGNATINGSANIGCNSAIGQNLNVNCNATIGQTLSVGGDLNVMGHAIFYNTGAGTGCSGNAVDIHGSLGVAKDLYVCGTGFFNGLVVSGPATFPGPVNITDTTNPTNCTGAAALHVAGGINIEKDLRVCGSGVFGGNLSAGGTGTFQTVALTIAASGVVPAAATDSFVITLNGTNWRVPLSVYP